MAQTRDGVKKNEWVQFMRVCAKQYKKQKAESKATQDSKAPQAPKTAFWDPENPENPERGPKTDQVAD